MRITRARSLRFQILLESGATTALISSSGYKVTFQAFNLMKTVT